MEGGDDPRAVAQALALALREEVAPELGRHDGRVHAGEGEGGDVTFAIDERAEAFVEQFVAERAPGFAFYSEDRGLVAGGGEPRWVLVVDPIDGTRPAMAGFESACVSVALARLDGEPRLGDVEVGCIVEIKSGQSFFAERGRGLEPAPALSVNGDLRRMFWTYGLRGRPARAIAEVLGDLIDASSVGGGDLRPRLGDLRHDQDRHRSARRLRRAGSANRRRRSRHADGVRAGRWRGGAQQLALRPGRRGALPRRGGGRRHRRLRASARRASAARLGGGLPDLLRRRRQPPSCTPRSCATSTPGSSACLASG